MKAKLIAEFLGTAFLVMIVFGSGIMGMNLFQGNAGLALLVNSIATGAGLFVLIQCLGSISGAHFNPVVSLVETLWGRLDKKTFILYCIVQILGALAGVIFTHIMFDQPLFQISTQQRYGSNLWFSEFIATFGLICTIAFAGKKHVEFAPISVAAYITSAYWFTSSTAFVNPAITIARIFTNTFCGMSPSGVPLYILFQIAGAILAFKTIKGLTKTN